MTRPLFVLSADDDQDDQLFISEALNAPGVCLTKLEMVKDGDALLRRLHQICDNCQPLPDLLLLDLNMPFMNGKEVLKTVRHPASPFKNIPVSILSTSNAEEDIVYCLREGADCFLIKPASIGQLTSILNNVLLKLCVTEPSLFADNNSAEESSACAGEIIDA